MEKLNVRIDGIKKLKKSISLSKEASQAKGRRGSTLRGRQGMSSRGSAPSPMRGNATTTSTQTPQRRRRHPVTSQEAQAERRKTRRENLNYVSDVFSVAKSVGIVNDGI
jgi:hypothetical protein